MAKHNPLKLTRSQENQLVKIKSGPTLKSELAAFGTLNQITDLKKLHSKWYYLFNKKKKKKVVDTPGSQAAPASTLKAYKIDKVTDITIRADVAAREEKMRTLIPEILKLKVKQYSIPIFKIDMNAMKKVANDPALANISLGFTKIKDNPSMMRLYRKK